MDAIPLISKPAPVQGSVQGGSRSECCMSQDSRADRVYRRMALSPALRRLSIRSAGTAEHRRTHIRISVCTYVLRLCMHACISCFPQHCMKQLGPGQQICIHVRRGVRDRLGARFRHVPHVCCFCKCYESRRQPCRVQCNKVAILLLPFPASMCCSQNCTNIDDALADQAL